MAHDIGETLAGAPVDDKPNGALEFLKKPENLATALVLAAALTSQRKQGQSRLNQGLTAGVGALAFRGGLEKGVQGQRATLREEERTAAESAADITQGEEQTAIMRERNRIAEEQLTTPRPLTESESALNTATAGLRDAEAANVGVLPKPVVVPETFSTLFAKNIALAQETLLPSQTLNTAKIAEETEKQLALIAVFSRPRLENGDFDATEAEMIALGITLLEPTEASMDTGATKPKAKASAKEDLSLMGGTIRSLTPHTEPFVRAETLRIARREGVFEGVSDKDVFETIATIRAMAQDPKQLEAMDAQRLQDMMDVYRDLLAPKELRNLHTAIRHATRTEGPRFLGIK